MKIVIMTLALFLANFSTVIAAQPSSFSFDGVQYEFRSSDNLTYSFTPTEQPNLSSRKEMVSFVFADDVKTKTEVKDLAENLLSSYSSKGKLLKAIAEPDTDTPSWYLLVAVMAGNNISEAIMTHVSIENATGVAMIYSHRFYGEDQSQDLIDWFEKNGFNQEANLISFSQFPHIEEFQ